MKRIGLIALSVAVLIIAGPDLASAQKVKPRKPLLLTNRLPKTAPGETVWAHLFWQGRTASAENIQMTVTAPTGYVISYPGDRAYAAPSQGAVLDDGEVDYASFLLTVPPTAVKSTPKLTVVMRYAQAGKKLEKAYRVRLPVRLHKADAVELLSEEIGPLAPSTNTWIHLQFEGHASLSGFQLVVTDSAGAGIYYPSNRIYSGLAKDSSMTDGEIDYAALKIDTSAMAEGEHMLKAEIRFIKDGDSVGTTIPIEIPLVCNAALASVGDALSYDVQQVTPTAPIASLRLNAGVEHAGKPFQVLGSTTGTAGVLVSNSTIPLTLDPYFTRTLKRQAVRPLLDSIGVLDTKGKGWATFKLRAGDFDTWGGQTVFHAFIVYGNTGIEFVSNAAPLLIGQ